MIENTTAGNVIYASGHLLFMPDLAHGAALRCGRLAHARGAFPIADAVQSSQTGFPIGVFSASDNGVLVYQRGSGVAGSQLVVLDRKGAVLKAVDRRGAYGDVELSRDGRQASVSASNPETNTRDVWIVDLQRGVPTRFTFDPQGEQMSIWAPDSSRLIYNTNRNGKFGLAQQSLNAGTAEDLLPPDSEDQIPWSWSPDGQHVLFSRGSGAAADIWLLPMTGERTPVPLLQTRRRSFTPGSIERAVDRLHLGRRWSRAGLRRAVSRPRPARSGLFRGRAGTALARRRQRAVLLSGGDLLTADVDGTGASFQVGEISKLFTVQTVNQPRSNYAVTPDGQQFVVNAPGLQTSTSPIVVVMNWLSDLQR